MLIGFRCASYHRRPPPRCCGAFERPSYDTVSAVTPHVVVAKYSGTEYKAFLRLIDLWKVWEEMKRFGAIRKNWEQKLCHAVAPTLAWSISWNHPLTRLFWKTTRPNNASCKNHPTLFLTFAEMPMRIPVIVVYVIICHMCLVSVQYRHRQSALNKWLPLYA